MSGRLKLNYERLEDEDICVYCGMPQECIDHWPPYSRREYAEETRYLLSSCAECNSLLHSSLQDTFPERVAYVKERLRKKYRKLLNIPEWRPEELADFGPKLRKDIALSLAARRLVVNRLAFDYSDWISCGRAGNLLPCYRL